MRELAQASDEDRHLGLRKRRSLLIKNNRMVSVDTEMRRTSEHLAREQLTNEPSD